jgi:hypothetical protein
MIWNRKPRNATLFQPMLSSRSTALRQYRPGRQLRVRDCRDDHGLTAVLRAIAKLSSHLRFEVQK